MIDKLTEQLKAHEGLRLCPYRCTAGKLTIGYGRNLDDKGISEEEAESMLLSDIYQVETMLKAQPVYSTLDDTRKAVLVNMAFNLGISGVMAFKNMWEALAHGEYKKASEEMLDSKWAGQVGTRAITLSKQMETGKWEGE